MEKAKIFNNGGSQAIRLPKDFRFDDDEVLINQIGNIVILMGKNDPFSNTLLGLNLFTEDYLNEKEELSTKEIELWNTC